MSDRRSRRRQLQATTALFAVFVVAISLRAGPLHSSPLPFNPDGIVYSGHVRLARQAGRFPLFRMPVDDLHFTSLLTVASALTGHRALYIAQPLIAVVGAVPTLVAAVAARRLLDWRLSATAGKIRGQATSHSWSLPRSVTPFVPVLAAALLGTSGLYLHRSMPVDEQTVGLLFVPLGAIAYARARRTGRRAWYAVVIIVALALPPTHNLDSVVFGLFLLGWLAVEVARNPGWNLRVDVVAAAGFWAYFAAYYQLTDRFTDSFIIQSDRLVDALDLFGAWIILVAIGLPWLLRAKSRVQRGIGMGVYGTLFGLLALNAVSPIFPEMPGSKRMFVLLLLPLAIPSLISAFSLPDFAANRADGQALLAVFTSGLLVIGFSLTAALTPEYLSTALRVLTFMHLPWAVFAAVGAASLLRWGATRVETGWLPRIAAVGVVVLVVCAAISIPMAFSGLELLSFEGITTEAEFAGSTHTYEHVPGEWAADDHLGRITRYYDRDSTYQLSAAETWLRGGDAPSCPTLSKQSWTTVGAQLYPKPPVAVSTTAYQDYLSNRSVVYTTGTKEQVVLTVPRSAGAEGC